MADKKLPERLIKTVMEFGEYDRSSALYFIKMLRNAPVYTPKAEIESFRTLVRRQLKTRKGWWQDELQRKANKK